MRLWDAILPVDLLISPTTVIIIFMGDAYLASFRGLGTITIGTTTVATHGRRTDGSTSAIPTTIRVDAVGFQQGVGGRQELPTASSGWPGPPDSDAVAVLSGRIGECGEQAAALCKARMSL